MGREAAAVSEPRARLDEGVGAPAFATVEVRFLGGMAYEKLNQWTDSTVQREEKLTQLNGYRGSGSSDATICKVEHAVVYRAGESCGS